jgi:LmbE family N-acetylglucosaminyl deacetylase
MVDRLRPERVLALGAHPDDIEIGCSGTLLKLADQGSKVHLYIASKGERGGETHTREQEALRAADKMGAEEVHWGGFIDCEIPHTVELIESIEKAVKASDPDLVIVHYREDTHQDHRALAVAAQSAARRVPNFLFYESPTSQLFAPSVYCNIEDTITRKIDLLETHFSQVARTNIEGLSIMDIARGSAIRRGIEVYCRYAEAFVPIRIMLG